MQILACWGTAACRQCEAWVCAAPSTLTVSFFRHFSPHTWSLSPLCYISPSKLTALCASVSSAGLCCTLPPSQPACLSDPAASCQYRGKALQDQSSSVSPSFFNPHLFWKPFDLKLAHVLVFMAVTPQHICYLEYL